MTEKRFNIIELEEESYPMILFLDNGKEMTDTNVVACLNALHEENEQLKSEINGLEELLKSYRKTIEHDAELLADATKKGYLPPLENWREL